MSTRRIWLFYNITFILETSIYTWGNDIKKTRGKSVMVNLGEWGNIYVAELFRGFGYVAQIKGRPRVKGIFAF